MMRNRNPSRFLLLFHFLVCKTWQTEALCAMIIIVIIPIKFSVINNERVQAILRHKVSRQ